MRKSIGNIIRELREENELKQRDLANELNIAKNTLSQYESGKRTPDLETTDQIAREFNVSMDYLCGVHDLRYNPRDKYFKLLMKILDTCSENEKATVIKFAKKIQEERK